MKLYHLIIFTLFFLLLVLVSLACSDAPAVNPILDAGTGGDVNPNTDAGDLGHDGAADSGGETNSDDGVDDDGSSPDDTSNADVGGDGMVEDGSTDVGDPDSAPDVLSLGPVELMAFERNTTIEPVTLPEAVNGTSPYVYELDPPPTGLAFNPATRVLRGLPTVLGDSIVEYRVVDGEADEASTSFAIIIVEDLTAPLPAYGLAFSDDESRLSVVHGLDFRFNWSPSPSAEVVRQELFLFQDGSTPDADFHAIATFTNNLSDELEMEESTDSNGACLLPSTDYVLRIDVFDADENSVSAELAFTSDPPDGLNLLENSQFPTNTDSWTEYTDGNPANVAISSDFSAEDANNCPDSGSAEVTNESTWDVGDTVVYLGQCIEFDSPDPDATYAVTGQLKIMAPPEGHLRTGYAVLGVHWFGNTDCTGTEQIYENTDRTTTVDNWKLVYSGPLSIPEGMSSVRIELRVLKQLPGVGEDAADDLIGLFDNVLFGTE